VRPRYPFFLPVKVLSRVFRGKFLAGLKRLYRRGKLNCSGPAAALAAPQQFAQLLRRLHRHDWVVYAKPAFGGAIQVLRYLGRYTHRVAISNHRLLAFDGEHVTFRYKDYAHGGKHRKMALNAVEFLRRFFLHVLPKGFVRIRHFGFLANRWTKPQPSPTRWQWKTPRRRRAALLELGVRPRLASNTAGSGLGPCHLAKAKALSVGLSNAYFKSLGLPSLFEEVSA
jgi:Putative transposase